MSTINISFIRHVFPNFISQPKMVLKNFHQWKGKKRESPKAPRWQELVELLMLVLVFDLKSKIGKQPKLSPEK